MAVETTVGWEIVQFLNATPLGDGPWRLTGLLRGQQGTDAEMRAGADAGAVVVMLNRDLHRVESGSDERGLPLIWRAGPAGTPPGGALFTTRTETLRGLHERPWSPCRLVCTPTDDGPALSWIPRVRMGGDGWDLEPEAVDPDRWRVRVLSGESVVRAFEVEGAAALYPAPWMAEDFPDGIDATARFAVAQWGVRFGWGAEAYTGVCTTPTMA
jgi:hypothetical protein